MKVVYFNQNGMWVYAGSVKKDYKVDDVIKLKKLHYPLRVVKIDNTDSRYESVVYCELIK